MNTTTLLKNPFDVASYFSQAFFIWPGALVELGSQKTLQESDVAVVAVDEDAYMLSSIFDKMWTEECQKANPSLLKVLFRMFGPTLNGMIGIVFVIESAVKIYQAVLLGKLIKYFLTENPSSTLYDNGYFISGLLVITGIAVFFMHHHFFFCTWRLGLRLRITMSAAIYKKSTKLNLRSLNRTAIGHIVNLCSQDVESFQQAGCFIHNIYHPIIESIGVIYAGVDQVGVSFLAGFGAILLLLPLQSWFSRMLSTSRKATAAFTDERLKLINQALTGSRLMKINGWEWAFVDIIERVRAKEVGALLSTNYLRAINEAIFFASPAIIGCFTFVTYSKLGGTLTPQKVFTVLTLFNITQFSLIKFFPYAVQFLTEAYVSMTRIQKLLMLEEVQLVGARTMLPTLAPESAAPVHLHLDSVVASWMEPIEDDGDDEQVGLVKSDADTDDRHRISTCTLKDISLCVTHGELVVVVGPVGCAKTSLLMAILGEIQLTTGSISVHALDHPMENASTEGAGAGAGADASDAVSRATKFAFCAQEPWILSSTIRENVLFGGSMDASRYADVLSACSMAQDIRGFPQGDGTVIGDRGVNLSGGQRARIGLARALYSQADIYLLDDPLSAVDAKVGKELFENAICGQLAGKTRILTTHQIQFLSSPHVSKVVVMKEGRIAAAGTYAELWQNGDLEWLQELYGEAEVDEEAKAGEEGGTQDASKVEAPGIAAKVDLTKEEETHDEAALAPLRQEGDVDDAITAGPTATGAQGGGDLAAAAILSAKFDYSIKIGLNADAADAKEHDHDVETTGPVDGITATEQQAIGEVSFQTFFQYFEHMGGWAIAILFLFLMMAGQGMAVGTNLWLAKWSRLGFEAQQRNYNFNVYLLFVAAAIVSSVLRSLTSFHFALKAAQRLHNSMLRCIVRAPILFFDSNPLGRVINRFAKDVGCTDDMLPMTLFDFVQCTLMVLSTVLVVCSGAPFIFLALVPLCWYFYKLRRYYLMTAREVKRFEAASRSPVFSHLTETLDGLVTIRAYQRSGTFVQTNKEYLNDNARFYFAFVATTRWLGFRLDVICAGLLAASTIGAVAAKINNAGIDPSMLAVGIMYTIQLAGLFQWCVRQSAELENQMISVERIVGFSEIESEPALRGPADLSARPEWPERGCIEAKELECKYRPTLPPVLRGLSFRIEAGERVGIVGRTGSGKSTLMGALLRLVDVTAGSMTLDGIDCSTVGLHDLRPKISVIPQTPFLFSGTVRQNLDAFEQHTDTQIWDALDAAGLRAVIGKLPGNLGLLGMCEENGSNFSVGERQLLCLARAILQRNKILVMDEATANVDMETDARVQETIRRQFTNATVLMIAHRLQTVIDCDKVMVMSRGRLVEMDHPYVLLTRYLNVGRAAAAGQSLRSSSSRDFASLLTVDDPVVSVAEAGGVSAPEGPGPQAAPMDGGRSEKMISWIAEAPPTDSFAGMVLETGDDMTSYLCRMALVAWKAKQSQKEEETKL